MMMMMTIAHRRVVDRVRSEQAATRREQSLAVGPVHGEDVTLAYYGGYTYPQVLLSVSA
jgi:hypothetical protein